MKFCKLAEVFLDISKDNSRLSITEKLKDLYLGLSSDEAQIVTYLALGNLGPDYLTDNKFNFAQKSLEKVISNILGLDNFEDKLKKVGDLSLVINDLNWPYKDNDLEILDIYKMLQDIKSIYGNKSQEIKNNLLLELFKKVNSLNASFIIKIILGNMRLGFSNMTIIDSLSYYLKSDKSYRSKIEDKYNICADLGLIAYNIKEYNIKGLDLIESKIGIPIRPAAAERSSGACEIINKIGPCIAQPKLDGFRLQVHLDFKNNKIWFYSRNLQDMSNMFPDLSQELFKIKNLNNLVIEGEAIVYDEHTESFLPFQETVKRKRKYDIEKFAQDLPLKFFIFDVLYLDDNITINKNYKARREILNNIFSSNNFTNISLIEEKFCLDAKELSDYFNRNISQGLEGLVVKKPDTIYQPGKRNFNWIKLKREQEGGLKDSIDVVILGYYRGKGRRANFQIGAFLVGIYNKEEDKFQTVAKIGTGLKDKDWIDLKNKCDNLIVEKKPYNVECSKELEPDFWLKPEIVVIVLADEITQSPLHSAGKSKDLTGLALRFPRFINYSLDKNPEQITDSNEIRKLYNLQYANS